MSVRDGRGNGRGNGRPAEIRLSTEERFDFLREIARIYRTEAAANTVLDQIAIPLGNRPAWQNINAEQWWTQIFYEFDAGIVTAPYRALLYAAIRTYAGNQTLRAIAIRHGVIRPEAEDENEVEDANRQIVIDQVGPDGTGRRPRGDDTLHDVGRWEAGGRDAGGPEAGRWAPPDPAARVFLCHAHQDKEEVRTLYRRLRGDGLAPWLDAEDLRPGQDWNLEIGRAIARCRSVVVCLSRLSITKRGFVQTEIARALDAALRLPEGEIFIIPARLEPCDLPDRLSRWHAVDLFTGDGYERLVGALRADA